MMKIVTKRCSCFIDRAVWFMNLPDMPPYWYFDSTINYSTDKRNLKFLDNHFIKEIRSTKTLIGGDNDYELLTKITVVKSCFDCFKFQGFSAMMTSKISLFNDLKCRFVTSDMTTFCDAFDSDIFVGNDQYVVERNFYSAKEKELFFSGEEIDFIRQPLHKPCFVSLKKKRYQFFCTTCKKAYNDFLEKELHVFSRIDK